MTTYTDEEIQEHRRLWLEALESGEYAQTTNYLARVDEDGKESYCCLGVACEVAIKNGLPLSTSEIQREDVGTVKVYGTERTMSRGGGEYLTLPLEVADWLGLGTETSPTLVGDNLPDEAFEDPNLTSLNDIQGWTFEQIAAAIRTFKLSSSVPLSV